MSNDLGDDVYDLSVGSRIVLWKLDFNSVPSFSTSTDGIIYLTAYKDDDDNIVFDGQSYEYVGVDGSDFRAELSGQLPQPKVVFDKQSLNGVSKYQTMRNEYTSQTGEVFFDWRGAKIQRTLTWDINLDNGSNPNTSIQSNDFYVVDQVTRITKSTIEIQLAVSVGADKINNESVQELALNRCAFRYRRWNGTDFDYDTIEQGGCPYGNPDSTTDWSAVPDFGNKYFTEQDGELDAGNKEFDRCSYSVKGCQLRFDPDKEGLVLPFAGTYRPPTSEG